MTARRTAAAAGALALAGAALVVVGLGGRGPSDEGVRLDAAVVADAGPRAAVADGEEATGPGGEGPGGQGAAGSTRAVEVPVTATGGTTASRVVARPALPVALPAGPVPTALSAPGVEAPVLPVGVDGAGAMAVPAAGEDVGWYRFGARPGDATGTVVLAGHVDTWDGGPGALGRARDLEPGDPVDLALDDGTTAGYVVVGRQSTAKTELPLGEVFARDGAPRLVLVTCGGAWDEERRSYSDNVLIIAEPRA